MSNGDPRGRIFEYHPHTHNRFLYAQREYIISISYSSQFNSAVHISWTNALGTCADPDFFFVRGGPTQKLKSDDFLCFSYDNAGGGGPKYIYH